MVSSNANTWHDRAGSAVRAALSSSWRARCAVMGKGWCLAYVPGSLRIIACPEHDVPERMTVFLPLAPSWGDDTTTAHALDALAKLPTLEGGA